jgi:CBS-domain-containing membrane protein
LESWDSPSRRSDEQLGKAIESRSAWRGERVCERSGMCDVKAAEPELKQRRLSVRDELLLAILPTATVLSTLGVMAGLGRHQLLCGSLASSAFLIYLDPAHQMNGVRTLLISQMTAAGVGWLIWLLLGGGYLAAASAIPLAILLMILLDAIHPPAVSTALAFSMHPDPTDSFVLFAIAVGITALLVVLQRAVSWLICSNTLKGA